MHPIRESAFSVALDSPSADQDEAQLITKDAGKRESKGRATRIAPQVIPQHARTERCRPFACASLTSVDKPGRNGMAKPASQISGAAGVDIPGVEPRKLKPVKP